MRLVSKVLRRIDGRGYKAYKELLGAEEEVKGVRIRVVKVQGDPFAPPSVVEATVRLTSLDSWMLRYPVALADWLLRRLYTELRRRSRKVGEGHSGYLGVPRPGPIMIKRSSLVVRRNVAVARLHVGLPSRRRRVLGEEAEELLLRDVPEAVRASISGARRDTASLRTHLDTWRLQEELREKLQGLGLVAFVGDGAVLPRKCGGCEEPLPGAVPFESPPSLRVEIETDCCGTVTGMGIRRGVTVIAGSAFHGKTTLLEAIAAGVWNHIPGDGRERVVTVREAMYIRAEDGRYISCVDVEPFIHDLPGKKPSKCFSTSDASGATSVAAAIQEAVEAGAKLLLLDEDTAATNMLYLDERVTGIMGRRTVTPLSELARSMVEHGISIIVVSTGSLPLLGAADTVVVMEDYRPRDATQSARELASKLLTLRSTARYKPPRKRVIESAKELRKPRVRAKMLDSKTLETPIPIMHNIHLEDAYQFNTYSVIAALSARNRGRPLLEVVKELEDVLRDDPGRLARHPGIGELRALDIAFLLNRLPSISMRPLDTG
ncbi:ABC-ATPase domain-containing protein [Pyrofollis japonicus]|uniref:ABC-ATPase domain-containing protein n=1 Tax=Pyrofollis japonicus TaxID=3060460 RepID=UPI00295AF4C3|nr:ABC-ATPase domain-containing protein [Pyrofollis japonicus]BEP18313.1 ABC-ATPase domain-containing protein [Pyrofollis japonicus]